MHYPDHLIYTKDHEWLKEEGVYALAGITDFAQKELGDIVYVDIPTVGETLKQHAVFGTVEAVKTVSDLFLPVSAEIVEVNPKIITNPELVNKDPYGEGWMIKIKVTSPTDFSDLLDVAQYKKIIGV